MKSYERLNTKNKKKFWIENPLNGDIEISIQEVPKFKMRCQNDDTVVKELYWTKFKGWEPASLLLWARLLDNCNKSIVLDIGTYTGIYSLIAALKSESHIGYAFDIQDVCLDRLRENIELNNLNSIHAIKGACTNVSVDSEFSFYKEDGIISSVASTVPKEMNNLTAKVNSIVLDDFLVKNNTDGHTLDLIKMDVEGAEQNTLKGLKKSLELYGPDVLIEINDSADLKKVKQLFPRGYSVYDINEKTLEIKKLNIWNSPSKFRNYLFTKKSRKDLAKIVKELI